jgi:hypothetical protein
LPGMSPRLPLQVKGVNSIWTLCTRLKSFFLENSNPTQSTPKNIGGRPKKKATPFNTSLSGPLSSINLNSSAGMKRAAVPPQGPPSKFGRSGGQLSNAALSDEEMEAYTRRPGVWTDASQNYNQ